MCARFAPSEKRNGSESSVLLASNALSPTVRASDAHTLQQRKKKEGRLRVRESRGPEVTQQRSTHPRGTRWFLGVRAVADMKRAGTATVRSLLTPNCSAFTAVVCVCVCVTPQSHTNTHTHIHTRGQTRVVVGVTQNKLTLCSSVVCSRVFQPQLSSLKLDAPYWSAAPLLLCSSSFDTEP
jgi:hypothetical protein